MKLNFNGYTEYENKLSEQIKTDSWAKRYLAYMEESKKNDWFYNTISISTLIYMWILCILMTIQKTYAFELSLYSSAITTVLFFILFKKSLISKSDNNSKSMAIISALLLLSISLGLLYFNPYDLEKIANMKEIFKYLYIFDGNHLKNFDTITYLFFIPYCFFIFNVVAGYSNSYEKYKLIYSSAKSSKKTFQYVYILFLIIILLILYILDFENLYSYKYGDNLSIVLFPFTFIIPIIITTMIQSLYYVSVFKLAKLIDKKGDKNV